MADGDDGGGVGPFPELTVFDLDACFWDQESEFRVRVMAVLAVIFETAKKFVLLILTHLTRQSHPASVHAVQGPRRDLRRQG